MTTRDDSRYVCLLQGSLHEHAASQRFLKGIEQQLVRHGLQVRHVAVQPGAAHVYPAEALATLQGARAVVLASPLYAYCLPGALMRLLEAWAAHPRERPAPSKQKLYAVINCGYPVPETMQEALRVVRHFCAQLGIEHRFSLAIGGGLVVALTQPIDLRLRRAYRRIAEDVTAEGTAPAPDMFLKPLVPRIFMDTIREHLDARVQRDVARKQRAAARAG